MKTDKDANACKPELHLYSLWFDASKEKLRREDPPTGQLAMNFPNLDFMEERKCVADRGGGEHAWFRSNILAYIENNGCPSKEKSGCLC